ncbi:MAG: N-(5'-phosphoribosyl)anthranilate isomerase [Betaproteobacteria bacterium ADurb.Bin341]|nr:MAG: N-(5'-phosphoribosyl)anthranilate isomerase [Betaproteobacteria bacterium ADurb.Bin341]
MKTRIKICGLTREADVEAAVEAGADAIGFVFYPQSPRFVSPQRAAELSCLIPPFVTITALFVNALPEDIEAVLEQVPVSLMQFHGDETEADCCRWQRPYLRAVRMKPGLDLLQYATDFASARALLLDAFVEGYGGGGQTFDWSLIPSGLPIPLVLSGGLTPENVGEAVRRVRPAAVDVSSGVEISKGIKDAAKIAAFVAAVRAADQEKDA